MHADLPPKVVFDELIGWWNPDGLLLGGHEDEVP